MKTAWRKELRVRFAEISKNETEREKWTGELIQHLAQFLKARSGDWCVYHALDSEISLAQLLPKAPHIVWVYPKVIGEKLHFFEPRQGFEKAFAGIMEPIIENAREISVDQMAGVLVPALGFDPQGVRLGKGKGYYDRALQNFSGETVGIGLSPLIVEKLPQDPWDVRMKWLATEKGVLKVSQD